VKTSTAKATYPGKKQVWRSTSDGDYVGDVVAGIDEPPPPHAEPLLTCMMRGGRRVATPPSLSAVRDRSMALVERLPDSVKVLDGEAVYPVRISERLRAERERLARR